MVLLMLSKYRLFRPFKDEEAWLLFRLAAYGEAVGWTILISGLLIKHFFMPKSNVPVLLAGQTHGMLFVIYIVAALVLAPSLGWSFGRTAAAGLFSVPPYGSLVFELWAAGRRREHGLTRLRGFTAYRLLTSSSMG